MIYAICKSLAGDEFCDVFIDDKKDFLRPQFPIVQRMVLTT